MDGRMTSTEAKEDSRGPDCIQHAPRTQYASVSVCQSSPHRLAPSDLVVWQTDSGQLFMQWVSSGVSWKGDIHRRFAGTTEEGR